MSSGTKKKTNAEFTELIKDRNFHALDEYKNYSTHIMFICHIDGNIWSATPNTILRGAGCPKCGDKSMRSKLRKPSKIISEFGDGSILIDVSTKSHPGETSRMDKDVFNVIKGRIFYGRCGYPVFSLSGKMTRVHKFVMNSKIETDHINGVVSDNRRCNLRLCTHSQNLCNQKVSTANKSGVTGVFFNTGKGMWQADIKRYGKSHYLGRFIDKQDAINARKKAEPKYFGEFAPTEERKSIEAVK